MLEETHKRCECKSCHKLLAIFKSKGQPEIKDSCSIRESMDGKFLEIKCGKCDTINKIPLLDLVEIA